MLRRSRTVESAPSRSALLTTNTSPISRMPALAAWMPSPMPGREQHERGVGGAATSTSDWPTPTVSMSTTSQPGGVEHAQRLRRGRRQPAEMAAGGHRADEDALVGGVLLHADAVAEQRAAGERRRRVDGEHARPAAPAPAWRDDERGGRRRLADARRAGDADDAAPARRRGELAPSAPDLGRAVLDERDQPRDVARATVARARRPAWGRRGSPSDPAALCLRDADEQGVALAAAAAQRGRADAAASALELQREGAGRCGRRTCRPGGRARSRRR